jgi:hypothetical protein
LELLVEADIVKRDLVLSLIQEADELVAIHPTAARTTRNNLKEKPG